MRIDKENVIFQKSFQFSLEVVLYWELLEENKKYVVSRQLLRPGASIGAIVYDAQNAESKADCIHKLKLAAKEADETDYWLSISKHTPIYPFDESLPNHVHELMKIIS